MALKSTLNDAEVLKCCLSVFRVIWVEFSSNVYFYFALDSLRKKCLLSPFHLPFPSQFQNPVNCRLFLLIANILSAFVSCGQMCPILNLPRSCIFLDHDVSIRPILRVSHHFQIRRACKSLQHTNVQFFDTVKNRKSNSVIAKFLKKQGFNLQFSLS